MKKIKKINKNRIGDSLESFLQKEGIREEVYAGAIKELIAIQLVREMEKRHISIAEMARRMDTSRAQFHRLIKDTTESVTLATLAKTANALGCRLDIKLVRQRDRLPSRMAISV